MAGFGTLPVGINVYVVSGISGVDLPTVFRGDMLFLIALIIGTALFIAWPGIVIFLPDFVN